MLFHRAGSLFPDPEQDSPPGRPTGKRSAVLDSNILAIKILDGQEMEPCRVAVARALRKSSPSNRGEV